MSFTSFLSSSLMYIIPLLIVAIAGMFAEKSGTINIALDGIMIFGAFCGIFFVNRMQGVGVFKHDPQLLLLIAIIIGAAGGLLYSSLLGFLAINMKSDQTIGGTALNMLAPALTLFLITITAGKSSNVSNLQFKAEFQLGATMTTGIGKLLFGSAYITMYIGVAIWVISIFVIYKTKFGLRLSACGENPSAAQSVGINVFKYRWMGVLISGLLAGIGGVTYIITTTTSFSGHVGGYGFLALAVLIFGQWRPVRIMFAAIFFGVFKALSAIAFAIPYLKEVNQTFYNVLPYLATMIILIINSKRSLAPKAAGIPFDYRYK